MRGDREPAPIPSSALPVSGVDSHTHLDACGARTPEDVTAIVDRAAAVGVGTVVTVADDLDSARWVARAVTWDDRVYGAIALHPTRTAAFDDEQRAELTRLAAGQRIVAIGETGLDYHWDYSPPAAQQAAFRWHIDLAKTLRKPLMIHDRDAHEDVLRILAEEGAPEQVVFHCFSGDPDFARRCVDAGYVLSFAGTVTFRNAKDLREAARSVPWDQLLVETDAPFLTPHPYRGRVNESYCLPYTLEYLATLRETDLHEVVTRTTANARRVFGLREVAAP